MKNKILFIASLLFGLIFINAGLNKFLNYMPMPENLPQQVMEMFGAMMKIPWLMPLIAAFEIVGGILVIIPRLRALGALVLAPILVGIVAHHITLGDLNPLPYIMAAILIWIIIENWAKYLPLIR